jgi:hypothetical protein
MCVLTNPCKATWIGCVFSQSHQHAHQLQRGGGGLIREQHLFAGLFGGVSLQWFDIVTEFACLTVPCPTNVPSAETVEISKFETIELPCCLHIPSLRLLNSPTACIYHVRDCWTAPMYVPSLRLLRKHASLWCLCIFSLGSTLLSQFWSGRAPEGGQGGIAPPTKLNPHL